MASIINLFFYSIFLLEFTQALKFLLQLMDAIGDLLISWQEVWDAVGGYAYRLLLVAFECPTGYHIVLLFADKQADGVTILRLLDLAVDAWAVEVEFADKLWLKLDHLEFDNHISEKLVMVEQKVCLELIAIDREDLLTTYERKTVA